MIIGLTGGIASGKGLVAGELERLGARIIDADLIAREVTRSGEEAFDEIVVEFGKDIIGPNGELDRKALGSIVFSDDEKRKKLNAITHPRIIDRINTDIKAAADNEPNALIVAVIPLLIETGLDRHGNIARIVVVNADEEKQLERLIKRDGIGLKEARKRLSAQMPLSEKTVYADYIINNNGTKEAAIEQTRLLYKRLTS